MTVSPQRHATVRRRRRAARMVLLRRARARQAAPAVTEAAGAAGAPASGVGASPARIPEQRRRFVGPPVHR